MTTPAPNPGSREAIALGCTCPILDNDHGKGYMGQPGVFIYREGCPVHPLPPKPESSHDDHEQPTEQ